MSGHHHHHHHDNDPEAYSVPRQGVARAFVRLLKEYASPYWIQLSIGIIGSLIAGGALAACLRVMDVSFDVLDAGVKSATPAPAAQLTETAEAEAVAELPPVEADLSAVAAAPPSAATDGDKTAEKTSKLLGKVNKILAIFGISPVTGGSVLSFRAMVVLIVCMLVIYFIQTAGELLHNYCLKWVGARVVNDLRCSLFDHLTEQSMGYFSRTEVGKLISRCTNDVNAVEEVISESVADLCTAPVLIVVSGQFIWAKAQSLGLSWGFWMMVVAIPICLFPVIMLSRVLKRYQAKVLSGISIVTSKMQECFSGIAVIKAYHQEVQESKRFAKVNMGYFRRQCKAILASVCMHPLLQFTAVLVAAVFVCVCYHFRISLEALAIMGFAGQQAYKPIKDLAKLNSKLLKSAAAIERIFNVIDTNTALPEAKEPKPIVAFNDAIVYEGVDFSYTPGGAPVLQDVNLTIRKGQLVALVGQTGSGKTTIANLLARFYDPSHGRVTIDGTDLRELKVEDFRKMVGLVSQDTFLFNTTIAENISYGRPDAPMEDVQAAARQANADEFITQLPEKYDYKVGERGVLLSGGQRQRISIARAILRNPPILILDEATSALDTVTERIVQEALNNVMRDRTVLAVAHRLSTIQKADLIVVMEQGRIVETGTHEELLALNGRYKRLHELQFNEQAT